MTILAQPTIWHAGQSAETFFEEYFSRKRSVLLIGGAGFDPRSCQVTKTLSQNANGRLEALFIREERSAASGSLKEKGDENQRALTDLVADSGVETLDVVASDNTVRVGLQVVKIVRNLDLAKFDDIVLDMSALSIGASFPIAQFLYQRTSPQNIHLTAWAHSGIDAAIVPTPSDTADLVRGFDADLGLSDSGDQPKIWLPQLSPGGRSALQILRNQLGGPIDVCPILPISQRDPRAADRLAAEYRAELESIWEVDSRNLIYAMEHDPLDLFYTISRIYESYTRVFKDLEMCHVVLTPSRNKILAIGALLSAMKHGLAVQYVESLDYNVDWDTLNRCRFDDGMLVHLWLKGDPYPGATHYS